MTLPDTRTLILDVAQELVQSRGYNGFSYRDIALRLGVRNAAIHYHFPSKGDLGRELLVRYRDRLRASLARIDEQQGQGPRRRLERYIQLVSSTLTANRMCICGVLAAEYTTLPEGIQVELRRFYDDNETWLARVLGQGRKLRALEFDGSPAVAARTMYAALQGAMAAARVTNDPGRLTSAGRWLLDALIPSLMEVLLPPA